MHTYESNKPPPTMAFNINFWSWIEGSNNRSRLARFGAIMHGANNMTSADTILVGSITLRNFAGHRRTCRVCLGLASQGLTGYRWGRHCRAVLDARCASLAPSLHFPEPEVRRERCSRGMSFKSHSSSSLKVFSSQYWKKNLLDTIEVGRLNLQGFWWASLPPCIER